MSHVPDHLFKGICICPCGDCTERVGDGLVMCVCTSCDKRACGAQQPTSGGIR